LPISRAAWKRNWASSRGDRVAFLGGNSPELLQILFACARVGAVFAPLNIRMTAEQLRVFLRHFQPSCMFAETMYAETVADSLAGLGNVVRVMFDIPKQERHTLQTLDALFATAPRVGPNENLPDDQPAMIVYTSGTTGTPKGAVLTHETLFYNAMNAIHAFDMTSLDEILTASAMSHVGGLAVHTMPAMLAGATVTIHRDFDAGAALRDIEKYRITLLSARPIMARPMIRHPDWHEADLSSLRSVTSGSTKVPLHLMKPWFDRGIPVQQNYGLTEAIPPVTTVPRNDAFRKQGSVGKPVLHCRGRVVDSEMQDTAPGERGQIILRGRSLFREYWRNPSATAEAFHDGWFLTGDIGHIDDEGFFYVDDRIKDIIIVGSSNVYPDDLERILLECDAVDEAAVVGRPDPENGEAIVACIVLKKGQTMSEQEVIALFDGRLAEYQKPSDILFMESIPKTMSGKVHKLTLRQLVVA
jgi:fatty-acyl-CoA synthase